ncbi:unnamed protein product [Anisakis simplex]|uniref:C2H2-type domain-containing protein n=1 Tax=Anisakis simplex TaxID=6269 RepID=A0A0M3JV94_ANISI|nr:unnamed protein product [Anisakis simplex]
MASSEASSNQEHVFQQDQQEQQAGDHESQELFEGEIILEMEQVISEEDLLRGIEHQQQQSSHMITNSSDNNNNSEHIEQIIVEQNQRIEEMNDEDSQQDIIHYEQQQQIEQQPIDQLPIATHFEETHSTNVVEEVVEETVEETFQPRRPVTRRSVMEQQQQQQRSLSSESLPSNQTYASRVNAASKPSERSSAPVPPSNKVVVLMKSNTSDGKTTFVKLEPVQQSATPRVRSEFVRALNTARKNTSTSSSSSQQQQQPRRKRRMIPPIVKKDQDDPKSSSKRGRPRKSAVDTLHSGLKKPKVESPPEEGESEEQTAKTTSGRPKRAHKAPKRFGDFYEEHVAPRDPASIPMTGLEPEAAEEDEDEHEQTEQPEENTSSTSKQIAPSSPTNLKDKKSVTARVVGGDNCEDEDFIEEEDEEEDETTSTEKAQTDQPPQNNTADEDEGEEASAAVVKLQGKEYEEYVARELAKGKLLCEQCHRFFANQNSMNAHRFKVHHIVIRASVKCPGCDHRATTIHTLNEHCASFHGLKLQFVRRKFKSTNEFQTYLDNLASTQNMAFVRHRKSLNKRQLYCNRSGAKRVTNEDTIRNRPRKGSAKIGAMCPAHMFYTECEDGSVEVNGQITHFGHTLDPRFVFPVTSSEKVTGRMKPSTAKTMKYRVKMHLTESFHFSAALNSMYGRIPVDLEVKPKKTRDDDGFINVEDDKREEDEEDEMRRMEEEERLEIEFGPLHPKAEEIDIRMKNIDRLCSFLFENVSEQLYRLDDNTMEVLLRALRTTQNTVSNLNSMMIQIKEGDPDVIQKYQRRGTRGGWNSLSANKLANRRRQRQLYDTEDYDEDTVYYRHVPLRTNTDLQNIYLLDDEDEEYYEDY